MGQMQRSVFRHGLLALVASTVSLTAVAAPPMQRVAPKPVKPAHPCASDATHMGGGKCCDDPGKKIVAYPDGNRCEVPKPVKPAHPCASDATHMGGGKCCDDPGKKIVTRPDGTKACQ